MNKDKVKGNMDKVAGMVKRKSGELTGDNKLQVKGIAQQARGELRTTLSQAKDAVRNASQKPRT